MRVTAHARRQTALASVAPLEAILAKTRITAPLSGVVITRSMDAGEHVEAGDAPPRSPTPSSAAA